MSTGWLGRLPQRAAVATPTMAVPDGLPLSVGPGSPFGNIVSAIDFPTRRCSGCPEALRLLAHLSRGHLELVCTSLSGFPYETVWGRGCVRALTTVSPPACGARRPRAAALDPVRAMNWSKKSTRRRSPAKHAKESWPWHPACAHQSNGPRLAQTLSNRGVRGGDDRARNPSSCEVTSALSAGPPTPPRFQLAEERDLVAVVPLHIVGSAVGTGEPTSWR